MNISNHIQQQPDSQELSEMAALVQQSLAAEQAATPTPSADEAWQRFAARHGIDQEPGMEHSYDEPRIKHTEPGIKPRPTLWRRWGIAASVALACMVVVAMSLPSVRHWVGSVPFTGTEQSAVPTPAPAEAAEVVESEQGVAFRNVPLSDVLQWVAENYHTRVEIKDLASVSDHRQPTASGHDTATELRLYVELDRGWTLQECISFLNRFEQVNLTLTSDNVIVTE